MPSAIGSPYDWYQSLDLTPSEDLLARRRKAASWMAGRLAGKKNGPDLVIGSVSVLVSPVKVGQKAVDALASALKRNQQALSSDVEAIANELRVLAALALREVMSPFLEESDIDEKPEGASDATETEDEEGDGGDVDARLLASAILCSALSRPALDWNGRIPTRIVSDLRRLAGETLEGLAGRARARAVVRESIPALTGADVPAALKSIKAALVALADTVDRNALIDREELELMWWSYGLYSPTFRSEYATLAPPISVIAAAIEAARTAILPPTESTRHVLKLSINRLPKSEETIGTLLKHVADVKRLAPTKDSRELVRAWPQLFPLTWWLARIDESDGTVSLAEFKSKALIDPAIYSSGMPVAMQLLDEETALRAWESLHT